MSEKSVSSSTSRGRSASQVRFFESAEALTMNFGIAAFTSSMRSYASMKKVRFPSLPWVSVSSSAAVWRAVSSLPSTRLSTPR